MARPLCTPKKVQNEASTRANSIATKPNSFGAAGGRADAEAADVQLLERQQLERKRILGPVLVDDRLDLGLHVGAHLLDDRLFLGGQDSTSW